MADMMYGLPEILYAFSRGGMSRVYQDKTAAKRVRSYEINQYTRYRDDANTDNFRVYEATVVWRDITDEL